jgi:hypothetical protein
MSEDLALSLPAVPLHFLGDLPALGEPPGIGLYQPIDYAFWQQEFTAGCHGGLCRAHDAGCPNVLVTGQPYQPLIFALRQNGEFLALRSLDELNLHDDRPSIHAEIADYDIGYKLDLIFCNETGAP